MSITIEATVANGQLLLKEPLPLAEGTAVRVTVTPMDQAADPLAGVIGIGASERTDGAEKHDHYIYGKIRQ